jgi:energy-converting hydrogenase Eha subunit A
MGPLDLFLHLLSFAAPAVAVGVGVALAARVVMPRQLPARSWWQQSALNSIAGLVVLGAGLWHFGVDGKMTTYAALVVAMASCQWVCGRGWRG